MLNNRKRNEKSLSLPSLPNGELVVVFGGSNGHKFCTYVSKMWSKWKQANCKENNKNCKLPQVLSIACLHRYILGGTLFLSGDAFCIPEKSASKVPIFES